MDCEFIPICVQRSDWQCSIEHEPDGSLSIRIGLNYAKGLRQISAESLLAVTQRDGPFQSVDDLTRRVPELNRKELVLLGADRRTEFRWRSQASARRALAGRAGWTTSWPSLASCQLQIEPAARQPSMPLRKMTTDERLAADYCRKRAHLRSASDELSPRRVGASRLSFRG